MPEGLSIGVGLIGATQTWRWFDRFEQSLIAGIVLGLIVIGIGVAITMVRQRSASPRSISFDGRFVSVMAGCVAAAGLVLGWYAWAHYTVPTARRLDVGFMAGVGEAGCIAGLLYLVWLWRGGRAASV